MMQFGVWIGKARSAKHLGVHILTNQSNGGWVSQCSISGRFHDFAPGERIPGPMCEKCSAISGLKKPPIEQPSPPPTKPHLTVVK